MDEELLILAESDDLSPIFSPLKTTNRIKYTCFNVSNNFLVFGATSGGLYVFRREPCVFLQLLPNREGSITNLVISPDEKFIAFSTVKGIVSVLERSSSHGAKHVVSSYEHQNAQVTSLQWNESNDELFVGDDKGKVSIVTVSLFPAKNMFQTPSFVLMQLDSKIVQMDYNSEMLLVSTLTKCYICDTGKELFRQVGHKPRDGEYGACIYNTQVGRDVIKDGGRIRDRVGYSLDTDRNSLDYSNLNHLKLLCARPGSRVWEVAIDGTVISTHHFKEALAVAPRNIIFQENSTSQDSDLNNFSVLNNRSYAYNEQKNNLNYLEQSFNFQKLYIILSKYLFTFKKDGIYIFDPNKAIVLLWNNEITDIVDVKCINDFIYIWSSHGRMVALNLIPLEKFLIRLYFRKKYLMLARLCVQYSDLIKESVNSSSKLYLLHDLVDKLKESTANENMTMLCDNLQPLLDFIKKHFENRQIQVAERLKSGIYVINNREENFLNNGSRRMLRPNYLNLKSRSHSASPDRKGLKHQGSTSSLPDLAKEPEEEPVTVVRNEPEETGNVTDVVKICEEIRSSQEPANELVYKLFDDILRLSVPKGDDVRLQAARPVPMNVHFDGDCFNLIADIYHSSLKSKIVMEWLDQHDAIDLKMYNKFMLNNCSVQSLSKDYKLSRTLSLFSSVLDRKRIFDLLKELNLDCYYLSMMQILDKFQDSSITSTAEATLRLANENSPINILNTAYYLIKKGQIEKCVRYSNKINLTDMLYLIFRYQEDSRKLSGHVKDLQGQTLFLSYLDNSLNRGELIFKCSSFVENYIIYCLQNINASCSRLPNCSCGFPAPSKTNSLSMFPEIGYSLVEKTWPVDPVRCVSICEKVPPLWKSLVLLRKDEPLLSLLPLIIQLGDLSEIEKRSADMDGKLFEICVRHLIGLKNGICLNCGSKIKTENGTITWSELGMLCVKSIGPQETLKLFTKYSADISSRDLGQTFYQAVVFSSIMEKHSKGLRKNIVDLLTGKDEKEANSLKAFSDEIKSQIFPGDNFDKVSGTSHYWGVKVDLRTSCAICSLSLDSKVLLSEAGLILFKCSHAFHSVCIRKADSGCPICN
ncbi:UNVERIFIED_CONTAM: hypothetical protein PYX00_005675 [Menopon gallinae]|uniref:RING-type domain-containing protein n=1 Tax=Menopon gallinae TaxID=328185 RepID=A0AAW2HT48_9NEOP